jgi:hypothetical protein
MAYKLTDKVPTEDGYYWVRISDHPAFKPVIVATDGKYVYSINTHEVREMRCFQLWSERIEEPEEPEEASKTKCAICGEEITKDFVTGYVYNKILRPGGPKYDEEYICLDCFTKKFIEHMKSNDQLPTS